jgi:hypothetical protein
VSAGSGVAVGSGLALTGSEPLGAEGRVVGVAVAGAGEGED